jgi:hypothetical protein
MTTATFTKSIQPYWKTAGRRNKLAGFIGDLYDENGVVLHSKLYDSTIEAEQALDDLVYELLVDYAERGLVDTLPVEDPGLTTAQTLAQSLANITRVPTHVVAQDGAYLVQDDADMDCYGGRAAIVATYAPEPPRVVTARSIPTYACTAVRPCTNPRHDHTHYAVTAQSIAIEAKLTACGFCQGIHHVLTCPDLRATLHAAYDTSEIAHLWGENRALLIDKLARLTRPQLLIQAIAFAAWLDAHTHAGLSAASILHIWETLLCGPAGAALPRAA